MQIKEDMATSKFKIRRKCPICGDEFFAKTLESWYCSPKCSKIAWKRKHDEKLKQERLNEVQKLIPEGQELITVPEAYVLFGVSRDTLYRYIRLGLLKSAKSGRRLTYVSKSELLKLFPLRKEALEDTKPLAKLYRMEPEDCYTIGEVAKKFRLDDSTVYIHIRKYSIPTRQIGNYVYVPKKSIDELYKDIVRK